MSIFSNANTPEPPKPMGCLVTVTFYKREKDGTPRFNDDTGARFWSSPNSDGSWRVIAKIDQAVNVVKNGLDISSHLAGLSVSLRLNSDDYETIKEEAADYDEGAGIRFAIKLKTAPNLGMLTITQSSNGRNGDKETMTLSGEILADEPMVPAETILTDTVDVSTPEAILEHIAAMKREQLETLQQSRATNNSAREGVDAAKLEESQV